MKREMLPVLPCACANLRRAARAVTRMYDRELRATGLDLSQFTLLMALEMTGETTQKRLAGLLAMDSTTLTRTLRQLVEWGWVRAAEGEDRREKLLQLSTAGRRKYQQVKGDWERVQAKLRARLGDTAWGEMSRLMRQVTAAAAGE